MIDDLRHLPKSEEESDVSFAAAVFILALLIVAILETA